MRKSKMWRMMTVAAVAASMTCGVFGVQSVSADDKKTLKVAMECGYAPYNWTQPDDSNGAVQISGSSDYAYGYDVMMAKKIADELGYDLEIVKLDWDSLVPAVQSGQVDCVIAGQSITKERQQMVDFTDPYYYASIITLVKNDGDYKDAASVEDLKGATVTSQQNTIWYDSCLPQIPDANILPAQDLKIQFGNIYRSFNSVFSAYCRVNFTDYADCLIAGTYLCTSSRVECRVICYGLILNILYVKLCKHCFAYTLNVIEIYVIAVHTHCDFNRFVRKFTVRCRNKYLSYFKQLGRRISVIIVS